MNPKYRVETISIDEIVFHDLVFEHPEQTKEEYQALYDDIAQNGQLVPVILYRNKLVDGRHRYLSLKDQGVTTIIVQHLPNNLRLEEVRECVIGVEIRRKLTGAQTAIKAYRYALESGISLSDGARKFGINKSRVSEAKKIITSLLTGKQVDKLYSDGFVILNNGKKYVSLKSIIAYYTENKVPKEGTREYGDNKEDIDTFIDSLIDKGDTSGLTYVISRGKSALIDLISE